jgi:hypothetical protein
MGGVSGTYGRQDRYSTYRTLIGRPEEKKPFGKPRLRWKDNIKNDIQEEEWGGVDRIHLVRDKGSWCELVNAVMNLPAP